jgi:hypothetical protein
VFSYQGEPTYISRLDTRRGSDRRLSEALGVVASSGSGGCESENGAEESELGLHGDEDNEDVLGAG